MEREKINDDVRAELPGNSADLAEGATYYQLDGSAEGDLVILVHGMTLPSFIWDPTMEALLEAGYRVLRYDLFGRGYSDRPRTTHNLQFYTDQLQQLVQKLNLMERDASLVGFSMGAGICLSYTLQYRQWVRRLCFIDPLHPLDMPQPPPNIWKFLMRLRFMAMGINNRIIDGLGNNFYNYEAFPDFEDKVYEQLIYKGFAQAVTSSLIDFEFEQLPHLYGLLEALNIPVALFWGEEDRLASFETSAEFLQLLPSATFFPIPEAGHLSHYERPDLFNPLLQQFLAES